jgi:hypothetical protein
MLGVKLRLGPSSKVSATIRRPRDPWATSTVPRRCNRLPHEPTGVPPLPFNELADSTPRAEDTVGVERSLVFESSGIACCLSGRGFPTLRRQLVKEAKEDSIRRARILYRAPVRRALDHAGAAFGGGLSDQPGRLRGCNRVLRAAEGEQWAARSAERSGIAAGAVAAEHSA